MVKQKAMGLKSLEVQALLIMSILTIFQAFLNKQLLMLSKPVDLSSGIDKRSLNITRCEVEIKEMKLILGQFMTKVNDIHL